MTSIESKEKTNENKRILIIGGSCRFLSSFSRTLKKEGISLDKTENPQEALDVITTLISLDKNLPDLIVLNLPSDNHSSAIAKLQLQTSAKNIPLIFIENPTANSKEINQLISLIKNVLKF